LPFIQRWIELISVLFFYFQTVLHDVDSLLYVDTDTLFLGPLEDVWRHFDLMNASQMAALTLEHEDPNTGWYNRFAKHPYYGHLGKYCTKIILILLLTAVIVIIYCRFIRKRNSAY
jgi:lipopolysaccharide biosynthesis glycosyltransferase